MTTPFSKILNSNKGKIIHNIFWLLLDKGLRMGLGLFIGVWIARYLGPEQFGKLNYGQAFIAIFSVIVNLGLDTTLVKELVSKSFAENRLVGTSFLLRLIGAITGIILAIIFSYLLDFDQDPVSFSVVAILSFGLIFQSIDVVELYLQSHLKSRISVLLKNSSFILSSTLKVYLLLNSYPLIYFAMAIVIDLGFAALLLLLYTSKKLPIKPIKWAWDLNIAKSLLKSSWPLIISALTVTLYMRMDQIMIKNILDSSAVGNYSAAVRITEILFFIPMIISNSVFPSLVKTSNDPEQYQQKLIKLYSVLFLLSVTISAAITTLNPYIITSLYGDQYSSASSVLNIHVWSSIFVFIGVASSQQLVIEGRTKISLYRTLTGLTCNLVFNIVMIPVYGVQGAAIASLISYAASSFFSNFFFKSTRSINQLYYRALFNIGNLK